MSVWYRYEVSILQHLFLIDIILLFLDTFIWTKNASKVTTKKIKRCSIQNQSRATLSWTGPATRFRVKLSGTLLKGKIIFLIRFHFGNSKTCKKHHPSNISILTHVEIKFTIVVRFNEYFFELGQVETKECRSWLRRCALRS